MTAAAANATTNPYAYLNTTSVPTGSSSSSASAATLSGDNSLASLATNFQSFLTLLTTQLQNQDPLNPTDTNEFTQQITQMSGVEQQLLSNQLLQSLVTAQGGVTAAANLIGDAVTAKSATASAGAAPISGTVTAVTETNGQTMLTIGGQQVPISEVTAVSSNANSLSSLLGS
jgi:flagellar basal-body rod modification protein FlgD